MINSIEIIDSLVGNPFLDKEEVRLILMKEDMSSFKKEKIELTRRYFSDKNFYPDVQADGVI